MNRRCNFFFGWAIVGIAFIAMVLVYGTRNTFSVFFSPILSEFGWSRSSTAFMLSLHLLIYGLAAPFAGYLGGRWKPKKVMTIGIITLSLAMASCAFASELWHFYVSFGIFTPLGTACCGWPLLSQMLSNWFSKRRGLVMGLVQAGTGWSYAFAMVAEFFISLVGWRDAYLVLAGILAGVMLPLCLLFLQFHPENRGLKAYGSSEQAINHSTKANMVRVEDSTPCAWTLRSAMVSHRLWLLVSSQCLYWGISCYLVLAHQVRFAQDVGFSSIQAASIFSISGILIGVGSLTGAMSDRIGREKTITLAVTLSVCALTALFFVRDTAGYLLLYIYAIIFGYGTGLFTATLWAGTADIFHGIHFGTISGLILAGMGIGGLIGPWLGGYIYDLTGNYYLAFVLCIGCSILSAIMYWFAAPRKGHG